MAKKSSSGVPYTVPTRKPSYEFTNGEVLIKVFYNAHTPIEVFQITKSQTQRIVLSANDYENFESRLKTYGFAPAGV